MHAGTPFIADRFPVPSREHGNIALGAIIAKNNPLPGGGYIGNEPPKRFAPSCEEPPEPCHERSITQTMASAAGSKNAMQMNGVMGMHGNPGLPGEQAKNAMPPGARIPIFPLFLYSLDFKSLMIRRACGYLDNSAFPQ